MSNRCFNQLFRESTTVRLDVIQVLRITAVWKSEGIAVNQHRTIHNLQAIAWRSDTALHVVFLFIHRHIVHRIVEYYWVA